jgi:hypothetical protein
VNDRIDFWIAGGLRVATIAPGTYDHLAWYDGEPAGSGLAVAVDAALTAAYGGVDWQVGVTPTGRVWITNVQGVGFDLTWASGDNAARSIGPTLGFAVADQTNEASYTGARQHQNGWYAIDPVVDDTDDLPAFERAVARAMGGQTKAIDFGTSYDRVVSLAFLPGYKMFRRFEGVNHTYESLERLFDSGWARFRWWPDVAYEDDFTDYVLAPESARALPRNRLAPGSALYSLSLRFWKWVA